jgi:N-dimethylarginine dimethylaminohydrolase
MSYSCSEVGELQRVALAAPPTSLPEARAPEALLFRRWPRLELWHDQYDGLRRAYERAGVEVVTLSTPTALPNFVFQRDLYFATPRGVVIGRPAFTQRQGEEELAHAQLRSLDLQIAHRVTDPAARFEGADALWLDRSTLLVGIGLRTNRAALDELQRLLAPDGVRCIACEMPSRGQHLLGFVNFVSERTAAVDGLRAPPGLIELLRAREIDLIVLDDERELLDGRALNFVAVSPGVVVMPSGCPRSERKLGAVLSEIFHVDVSEYIAADGGVACATGILQRDARAPTLAAAARRARSYA